MPWLRSSADTVPTNFIVHTGYYARVKGMRILLDQFLSQTECNCQIINLGAGFDTLFWLLKVRRFMCLLGTSALSDLSIDLFIFFFK